MILNPCLTNGLGVYLLDQGVYHVVSGTGVKISQIVGEVFGQETLWGECFEYKLQVQTHECRYIFITKQLFLEFVMPEIIDILKQAYKVRQTARRKFESNNIQNL